VNLFGQPAHVGRHCGSHEYEVTPAVVAFYAEALDDPSPLYVTIAPPLLYHSECYKFAGEWYLRNLFGNLHARQDWELFAPIPVGSRVRTRSTIVERYHKRGRNYVVNETDVCAADDGRLLVRGRTHQSFLPAEGEQPARPAQASFVVDEGTARRKAERAPAAEFPTATGPELAPVKKTIDQRRCWMFSGPGRNYHTDAEQARKLGFPKIVVQGMMSSCFASQVMQDHFGNGWIEGGKLSLKLVNVLWVDETVTARAKIRERESEGSRTRVHCDVWVEKDDGTRIALGSASALE
jgi:acyl dehydratase